MANSATLQRSSSLPNIYTAEAQPRKRVNSCPNFDILPTTPPLGDSPPLTVHSIEPLNLKQIFKRIKPLLCQVVCLLNDGDDEGPILKAATGFFITNSGLLVTSFRLLENQIYDKFIFGHSADRVKNMCSDYLRVKFQGQIYRVSLVGECSPEMAEARNLCLLQIETNDGQPFSLGKADTDFFELPKNDELPEEGDEIYFGGFPLTEVPVFHSGSVSSVLKDKIWRFTVDGTVMPKSAGSPVLRQMNGVLQLIGVVDEVVSDLDPQFEIITQTIAQLTEQKNVYYPIGGDEEVPPGILEDLHSILVTLLANLSTGVGKVVHAGHIHDLEREPREDEKATFVQREIVDKAQFDLFLKHHNWRSLGSLRPGFETWENNDPDIQSQMLVPIGGSNFKTALKVVQLEVDCFFKKKLETLLRDKHWSFLTCDDSHDTWGFKYRNQIFATVKFPSAPHHINQTVIENVLKDVNKARERNLKPFIKKELGVFLQKKHWKFLADEGFDEIWGLEQNKQILATIRIPLDPNLINQDVIQRIYDEINISMNVEHMQPWNNFLQKLKSTDQ